MENAKFYTFEQLDKEMKKAQRKQKREKFFNDAKNWINNNTQVVLVLGPIVIGGVFSLVKMTTRGITKQIQLHKEDELKTLYCYDRSLGHYWKLRRKLKNSEWVQIDKRKANGERLADILEDLKVLK